MSPKTPRLPRSARLRAAADLVAARRAQALAERERREANPWQAEANKAADAFVTALTERVGESADSPSSTEPSAPGASSGPAAAPSVTFAIGTQPAPAPPSAPGPAAPTDSATRTDSAAASPPPVPSRFGVLGQPVNQAHPFVIGFTGACGVLVAWFLLGLIGKLSSVLTLVVIALFLALALDPLVRGLQRRGLGRGAAVGIVFLGVTTLFVGFGFAVVPPLVREATELSSALPDWVDAFQNSAWVQRLDQQFGILNTFTEQLQTRLRSGETVLQLFGGVLGAGQAVISGAFGVFTVFILTLYFTASLNTLREAVYKLVPSSRRDRVRLLGDEIIRRIGGYTAGQVTVASINALCTYVLLLILGLPFALVLAITVGVLGLIPLIGATLGAVVITTVALFQSWQLAVIVIVYYLLYQQIENYLIAPRIMMRTTQVPGFVAVIAALAGGALLGVLGALIAIPIAAGVLLIVQEVIIPRQEQH